MEKLFNPKNTFSTFVVGDNNSFAHAAALAVAQSPRSLVQSSFLYGGVGLGKTHLLHAIAHYALEENPRLKVAYLSSEKFTNKYIDAIQNNELAKFRRTYRKTDILLIDDIQFLAGKERIQEEFFHTFNALHEGHKQIVMTCDRPANEIKDLEKRLVSRFEWGLVTDMQPPNYETRLAILRKKAASIDVQVPEDVVALLAKRIRSNIRRLEGALIRVSSYQSLIGKPMSPSAVEGLLRICSTRKAARSSRSIKSKKGCGALRHSTGRHDQPSQAGKHRLSPSGCDVSFTRSSPANRSTQSARHSVGATMAPCCTPAD